ncbi:PEP-CTERM protein-sorting domain-containing protein [Nitrosomonas sp. Nm51]|uniref:PEP-CTERM sorting domain-containing protein n=1 Tax=Nitrosomonas sp. Nm51 TaxID=133720 RepID=UPI0008B4FF64|nr:PEP-CTERM sorting domain-containing protein [Nitrosomonas sp. Nm51]SER75877.1 PEP-CTERM protein-sorting domain-containing protein [Nitrosomonas sp. Nm51]
MKNLIKTGIIIFSLGLMGATLAGPVAWDTNSGSATCSGGVGNSCTFTENGHMLTARAYSTANNSGSGVFEKATLTVWSGGLGVRNPDQYNERWSPHHALDDRGRDELIVFENNYLGYAFTGFEIGWRRNDSDISAWVGSLSADYDFTGVRFSGLAGLGFTKTNFNNVPTNTLRSLGSYVGNYLILAPKQDSNSEYVKIRQINGNIPNQIPEPGTLILFAAAALGLWIGKRRNVCW